MTYNTIFRNKQKLVIASLVLAILIIAAVKPADSAAQQAGKPIEPPKAGQAVGASRLGKKIPPQQKMLIEEHKAASEKARMMGKEDVMTTSKSTSKPTKGGFGSSAKISRKKGNDRTAQIHQK